MTCVFSSTYSLRSNMEPVELSYDDCGDEGYYWIDTVANFDVYYNADYPGYVATHFPASMDCSEKRSDTLYQTKTSDYDVCAQWYGYVVGSKQSWDTLMGLDTNSGGETTTFTLENSFDAEVYDLVLGSMIQFWVSGLGIGFMLAIVARLKR